jgi:fimbrial isopeptide formation D2 family protein
VGSNGKGALAKQGSLTLASSQGDNATYDAYQVFAADVDAGGAATNVTWASGEMSDLILPYLDDQGYGDWLAQHHPGDGQREMAQNAAEYISATIGSSSAAPDKTPSAQAPNASFSNGLAKTLADSPAVQPQHVTAGETFAAEQGLWLLVSSGVDEKDSAGTAPIWVPVTEEATQIADKSSLPTIDKQVREDSDGSWGKLADANRGQDLEFSITGTLPENLGAYSHYHYRIVDHFSEGIEPAVVSQSGLADAIKITIDGTDAKPDDVNLILSYDQGTLSIEFTDLLSDHWEAYGINAQSVICVRYQAHLTQAAIIGAEGNPNEAYLVYTNDPVTEQDGQTNTVVNKVFAYALELQKKGADGKTDLKGAKFSLRPQGEELYVQQDGSLGSDPYDFVTDDEGRVRIPCLDEGDYALKETEAPDGYSTLPDDLVLTITSEHNATDLTVKRIGSELSGNQAQVEGVDATSGLIEISVTDKPIGPGVERLAQTGGGPAAAALAGSGLGILLLSHAREATSHKKRYRRRH